MPACRSPLVAGELDEVDLVQERDGTRKVGEEDEAGLEQRDEQEVPLSVVLRDLGSQLANTRAQLGRAEKNLSDAGFRWFYEARSNRYRCASRSMSRL